MTFSPPDTQTYAAQLVENLPPRYRDHTPPLALPTDLVLEGGAFNGAFAVGAALFVREMERAKILDIRRVSGCSIGAIIGALYCLDILADCVGVYTDIAAMWRTQRRLPSVDELHAMFVPQLRARWSIDDDGDATAQLDALVTRLCPPQRLWITYCDTARAQHIVVHTFDGWKHLLEMMARSSFLPMASNRSALYRERYLDGVGAHVFDYGSSWVSGAIAPPPPSPSSVAAPRVQLHVDPMLMGGVWPAAFTGHETNASTRIMSGMLDTFRFFEREPLPTLAVRWTVDAWWQWLQLWWWPNSSIMCAWSWPHPVFRGVRFRHWRWTIWNWIRQLAIAMVLATAMILSRGNSWPRMHNEDEHLGHECGDN